MSDSYEHNPLDHEDPVAGPTWIIGLLSVVLLIVTFFGVIWIYDDADKAEIATKEEHLVYPVDAIKDGQLDQIQLTGRKNQDALGEPLPAPRIVIPIDQAMAAVVAESGS